MLAVVIMFAAVAAVTVVFVFDVDVFAADDDDDETPAIAGATVPAADAAKTSTKPESNADGTDAAVPGGEGEAQPSPARSKDAFVWTVATPSTLDDLERTWTIPRATLAALNPGLPADQVLAAGTEVIVHAGSLAASESVGPPNDGRLLGAVPLPEGRGWILPADRTRAFATGETIVAITAALVTYAAKYPDATPVHVGELSARRGGPIYGHQSHQTGRDIDVRLIVAASGENFDPERNWSLVKAVIDGGQVASIFLNRTQQEWLRLAAVADVGEAEAARYFALISHERGHTIHMHVRFLCPDSDKRCVHYSPPDSGEHVPDVVRKLPGGGSVTPARINGKLPTLRPKTTPTKPSGKLPGSTKPGTPKPGTPKPGTPKPRTPKPGR